MGMYTGIRFKGIVKEKFRKDFDKIALNGDWEESEDTKFKQFGLFGRSGFIPRGVLCYMPESWEADYINDKGEKEIDFGKYYKQMPTDGFERTYNEETGYWTFQCSLKNYEDEIGSFFELIPYFIESIEHLEYFYEEMTWSKEYKLIDNGVVLVNDKFIKYNKY